MRGRQKKGGPSGVGRRGMGKRKKRERLLPLHLTFVVKYTTMFLRTNCRSWKVQQSLLGDSPLALQPRRKPPPLVNGRAQGSVVGRVEKGKVTDSLSLTAHKKEKRRGGKLGSLSLPLAHGRSRREGTRSW